VAKIVPAAFSEQSWEGTVETVAVSPRQIQGQGKSYPVKIRLKPSETLQFHTGMSCRAEIATRGTNATPVVAVPVQAVKYEESTDRDAPAKSTLFVVKDGRVKQRTVETGLADDVHIAITKGLAAGEQVVVGPARVLRFLREDERVKPAPVAEDAPAVDKKP